jgi:6-phosphogluconolactonase
LRPASFEPGGEPRPELDLSPDAETRVLVFGSAAEAAAHAAASFRDGVLAGSGPFHVALAGGSTPALVFDRLAAAHARDVPWERVEFFFGDERAVPPDHAASNYGLARVHLLERVPARAGAVHRMPAEEEDLKAAALRYEEEVRRVVPAGPAGEPAFDLIWLGLGDDGHTASLFPGTPALEDTEDLVAPGQSPDGAARLTFTLPLIQSARRVQFLVLGRKKAAVVRRILGPPPAGSPLVPLPAARVRPLHGTLEWVLDREAAEGIAPGR